jgi:hypothetical protein
MYPAAHCAPDLSASGLSERLRWHNVHHHYDPDAAPDTPPVTYTVGLAERPGRAYEVAATGLGFWLALHVVEKAAEQLQDDALDPADGLVLDRVLNARPVRLRRVPEPATFHGLTPDTPVWQVLTPDKWHRFPGDKQYAELWPQPLL